MVSSHYIDSDIYQNVSGISEMLNQFQHDNQSLKELRQIKLKSNFSLTTYLLAKQVKRNLCLLPLRLKHHLENEHLSACGSNLQNTHINKPELPRTIFL
jgi:hypothetical protein